MALRRGIGGLSGLLTSLSRMSIAESSAAAQPVLPASTLASLRSLRLPSALGGPGSHPAAAAAPGSSRGFAAAAAAAPPAPQAAAAAAGEEESLEQIRSRIFGTYIGNGQRSGRKVLRRPLVGARVASYYPEDPARGDPLMLNLAAENAKLRLDRLRRRGKAPPKKGAGKRAGKKK